MKSFHNTVKNRNGSYQEVKNHDLSFLNVYNANLKQNLCQGACSLSSRNKGTQTSRGPMWLLILSLQWGAPLKLSFYKKAQNPHSSTRITVRWNEKEKISLSQILEKSNYKTRPIVLKPIPLQFALKKKPTYGGTWGAQSVKRLPSVQVMISGSWDPAPRQAPCSAGTWLLLLPLLVCFSLSSSLSNK